MAKMIALSSLATEFCQSSAGQIVAFRNCRLFRNGQFVPDSAEIWIRNGKVLDPQMVFYGERKRPDAVVDCQDLILAPGLLDIQVNGAFGVDFTSLCEMETLNEMVAKLEEVAQRMPKYGLTGFCPTIITARPDAYKKFLKVLNEYNRSERKISARILGAHFEGPFISPKRSGCHPKSRIIASLADNSIDTVYGSDLAHLAYVTIAPELPCAISAIEQLCAKGIKVAIGHTDANYEEAQNAISVGAKCITHLFNAMRPFDHRDPGTLGLLMANHSGGTLYYGLISDGVHVDECALAMAVCACPQGPILVTDCIAALGLGDGVHTLGDVRVRVRGPVAKVEGMDTLAGSVSSMPHCLQFFSKVLNKYMGKANGVEEALKAATLNPAKFLELTDQMGTLNPGTNADFVLLDDQLNVRATFIGGQKCYQADK